MKTNFLKSVKHSMFLLLAILGTIAGYSQQTTPPGSTIGGSKTPGDIGGLINPIGGRGTGSDTGQYSDTGGKTPAGIGLIYAFQSDPTDIGGRGGSDTGTGPFNIGGKSTPGDLGTGGLNYTCDIGGGKSSDGGGLGNIGGRDSGGGLIINPFGITCDIGGGSTGGGKGTSSDTGQIAFLEFECTFTSFSNDMQGCIKNPALETPLFQF